MKTNRRGRIRRQVSLPRDMPRQSVCPFSDEDMQVIYEAHMSNEWSAPMSVEEALAEIDRIEAEAAIKH